MAVKHMAMQAKSSPPRNEKGMMKRDRGRSTTPNAMRTRSITDEYMKLLVAPHSSSPVTTSSIESGVAIIASKVFW